MTSRSSVRHVTAETVPDGERFLVGLEFVEPSAAALAAD